MPLEGLVHGEVARGGEALQLGVLCLLRLKLEHFEQAVLAAARDPSFARVPAQRCQLNLVRDGYLLKESIS